MKMRRPQGAKDLKTGPGGLAVRTAAGIGFFAWCLLFPFFCSYGAQHIVLYHVGEKDPTASMLLKKHLTGKGFVVSAYEGTDDIEAQVVLANKINRLRASFFIAVDFSFGQQEDVTIAVTNAGKKTGQVPSIEDVPGMHAPKSREFASLVAETFGKKVLELPLFPLLGIDMPGIFMRIECPKEQAEETLGKVSDNLQKYLGRGIKK